MKKPRSKTALSDYERAQAAERAERAKLYWPKLGEEASAIVDEFVDGWTPTDMLTAWRQQLRGFG